MCGLEVISLTSVKIGTQLSKSARRRKKRKGKKQNAQAEQALSSLVNVTPAEPCSAETNSVCESPVLEEPPVQAVQASPGE
jgi:hypothetical protein